MDEALAADCARSRRLVRLINGTTEEQAEYRVQLLRNCLAGQGKSMGGAAFSSATTAGHISVGEISMPILTVSFWMYVM